jgi:hypothetical protein
MAEDVARLERAMRDELGEDDPLLFGLRLVTLSAGSGPAAVNTLRRWSYPFFGQRG